MTPAEALDAALLSAKGVRIPLPGPREALAFRMQCYGVLRRERRRNLRAGLGEQCDWDDLVLRVYGSEVLIQKADPEIKAIPLE